MPRFLSSGGALGSFKESLKLRMPSPKPLPAQVFFAAEQKHGDYQDDHQLRQADRM
jgi:hypothetical protein